MPQFRVRLAEPGGRTRRLAVQAPDAAAVASALGVSPARLLDVQPADAAPTAGPGAPSGRGAPLAVRLFAQELAVLLDAGIPLLEGLRTLREKDGGRATAALDTVIDALGQGQSLSAALAGSRAFDELTVALVAASERSGQLASALRHHAAYLAWSERLRAQLVAAAVYPALLLAAGAAVVAFLLLFVLPRFAGVFDGVQAAGVPLASRWLMQAGVAASRYPGELLIAMVAVVALTGWALRRPAVRHALQARAWRVPGVGPRLRTLALARLYRCVGLLAQAGVPVPEALRLAENVLASPLRPALREAARAVVSGQRLSAAWHAQGLLTPVALRMLRVGEGSGSLAPMLERAAAFHDEELSRLSELVTKAINPLLMLLMGVVIGGIVILMYLPIFTLMEQVA